MNKIYSKVWNPSLGQLVVASELASGGSAGVTGASRGEPSALRVSVLATIIGFLLQAIPLASYANTYPAQTCVSGTGSTVGRLATGKTTAQPVDGNGTYSNVLGCNASGNNQLAASVFGSFSQATGTGAAVFGFNSTANKWASAFGLETVATGVGSTALGFGSNATGLNALAIGGAGGDGTTAATVANSTTASASNAIAIGTSAKATTTGAIAFGAGAQSSTTNAIAMGQGAQALQGSSAIAIGSGAVATTTLTDKIKVYAGDSIALGNTAQATGQDSLAIGGQTTASGVNSINIGNNFSTSKGDNAIAIGVAAHADADSATTLGTNAVASNVNDIALGADTTTAAAHTGATALYGVVAAGVAKTASGVVSVGKAGAERQVQNVAAGVISATSTDAINGSQLNSVATGVNSLGTSTATTLGGGSTYSPTTGAVTGFSQPINPVSAVGAVGTATPQTTVAGALAALNTSVDNTANIAVKYDQAGGNLITLGATGGAGSNGTVKITNLTPATLSATSTDAVNGSQLYATNQNVATNTTNIAGNTASINSLTTGKIGPFVSDNSVTTTQPVSSGANANAGGFGATATGAASDVVGNQATDNGVANSTVMGQGASIATGMTGSNVALGQGSTVTAAAVATPSTALNGTTYNFAGGTPGGVVSVGSANVQRQVTNVAAGQLNGSSTDAVNGSQLYATNSAISNIANGGGIKYFHANSTGIDSSPTGVDAIAVGASSVSSAHNSIAIGTSSLANSTAGDLQGNTAVGTFSQAVNGSYNTSLGYKALATGTGSLGGATYSTAIGGFSQATQLGSTAIGGSAKSTANSGTAVGDYALASGAGGTAVGGFASASGTSSIALGGSTLLGGATASNTNAIALGAGSTASAVNATVIGSGMTNAQTRSVLIGVGSTIGTASSVVIGDTAAGGTTGTNVAIGGTAASKTSATGSAVAIGLGQTANGAGAVAIGDPNAATGTGAVAVGGNNTANGQGAVALGNLNSAVGQGSVAVGNASNAAAAGSLALGDTATASASKGVALGSGATASNANDVALGGSSVTATAHTGTTALYGGVAGGIAKTASGVVSVGAAGAERQIQNVAAGVISATSTDAINGSQLNSVATGVNSLGTSTATTLGGGSTYSPTTGAVTGFSQPINPVSAVGAVGTATPQTTVAGALAALNTSVDNTANIAVKYDQAGGNLITLGATGGIGSNGTVMITNLTPATLSAASTDAVNGSQLYATNQSIIAGATHYYSVNDGGTHGSNYANDGATATNSLAAGVNASASTSDSIAVGSSSHAGGTNGYGSDTAFGTGASALGGYSIALGAYAATGTAATSAIAIGNSANALNYQDVVIGTGASTTYNGGQASVVIGAAAKASAGNSIAIGPGAVASATNSTAIGFGAQAQDSQSMALGLNARAQGNSSIATGFASTATGASSVAMGFLATATNANDIALGSNSVTAAAVGNAGDTIDGVAYTYAGSTPGSTLSIGSNGAERTITNVAAGQINAASTDAINGSQLYATNTAINSIANGGGIKYFHANSTLADSSATGADAVAIGPQAVASGAQSIATGVGAAAFGTRDVSMGYSAGTSSASGNVDNLAFGTFAGSNVTGSNNIALGRDAGEQNVGDGNVSIGLNAGAGSKSNNTVGIGTFNTAGADNAVAIGFETGAGGVSSIAIGGGANGTNGAPVYGGAQALADNAISLGAASQVDASATGAMALGLTSRAAHAGDVALGAGSVTAAAIVTTNAIIAGVTTANFAGTNPLSTVSVGTVGGERTITNVAAGRINATSTDAINGSQLNATNDALTNVAASGVQYGKDPTTGAVDYSTVPLGGPVSTDGGVTGGTTISNVHQGAVTGTSTDAINGAQLYDIAGDTSNTYTTENGRGIKYVRTNDSTLAAADAYANGVGSTAVGYNATSTGVNALALGNGATAGNASDVALGAGSVTAAPNTGATGLFGATASGIAKAASGVVSVGSAGNERQIQNVAAGVVSDTSTDAINGSQLSSVVGGVNNLGNSVATQLGGTNVYDPTTGAITGGFTYDSNPYTSVQNVFNAIDGSINGGLGIKYFHANSTLADSVAAGANAVAIGPTSNAYGDGSIAQGYGASAGTSGSASAYTDDIAIGSRASAAGALTYQNVHQSSIAIGGDSLVTASGGIAIGANALVATQNFFGNGVAIGEAAQSNTSATVAIGSSAGRNYVGGGFDTLIGANAGSGSTNATPDGFAGSTLVGMAAGSNAKLGYRDVFMGYQAGEGSSYGPGTGGIYGDNTGIGSGSFSNSKGELNVAIGSYNIGANSTGSFNTALGGIYTGHSVVGNDNVALGSEAGVNVTGNNNIGIGSATTIDNPLSGTGAGTGTTGSNNIALGASAGQNITADNTIAIGQAALSSSSSAVAIGTSAQALGGKSVSIGAGNTAYGDGAVSIGDPSYASGTGAFTGGANNIANNDGTATATSANMANGAVAIGNLNKAVGQGSVALGNSSNAAAAGSLALGDTATASASKGVALGSGATAGNANDVALGAGSTTAAAVGTTNATIGGVTTANFAGTNPLSTVSVGTVGGERTITNVAAGRINTTSTDAINGSQLNATNNALTNVAASGVQYGKDPTTGAVDYSTVPLAGPVSTDGGVTGGTTISNVHQGAVTSTSTDAINGAQLYDIAGDTSNTYTTENGRGIKYVRTNDSTLAAADAYANGVGSTAVGYNATSTGVNALALGNGATATNANDVALGSNSVTGGTTAVSSAIIGGTMYTFAGNTPTAAMSVGGRQIQNVAAGQLNADSTDAVNGSQLFAANTAISTLSNTVDANKTHYYSVNDGGVQGKNFADDGATGINSIASGVGASALGAGSVAMGNNAVANNAGDVALGSGSVSSAAVGTSSATINGVTFGGFAGSTPTSTVSVGSVGNERQIQNVAAGQVTATSTDAINGSQLYSVANQITTTNTNVANIANGSAGMFQVSPDANTKAPTPVGTNSAAGGNNATASANNATALGNDTTAAGENSTAVGNGARAAAADSVAIGANSVADKANTVSVGSVGATRQITNVTAGTAATDAVNVSQLQASQGGGVQYDKNVDGGNNYQSVTMGNGSAAPTVVHNVGAGTAMTDAANVGQLNSGIQQAQDWSKAYTDSRYQALNQGLNTIANRANGGIASAMAMASLPQAYAPNQSSAGVAFGSFHGESGIAIGVSTITESGHYIFKANATANSRGDTGVGVGAAVVW